MTHMILFREFDLRLFDHAPLHYGLSQGGDTAFIFIWDDSDYPSGRPLGSASKWWLLHSLKALQLDIKKKGGTLSIMRGHTATVLQNLCQKNHISHIFFHKGYDPRARAIEESIQEFLKEYPVQLHIFEGQLLFTPQEIFTKEGKSFSVFTPFWKCCLEKLEDTLTHPLFPLPHDFVSHEDTRSLPSITLDELGLYTSTIDWAKDFTHHWTPGEQGAHQRLNHFIEHGLHHYHESRNHPFGDTTSKLSAPLRFGEISVRTLFKKIQRAVALDASLSRGAECFLREIGWREFSYHLLYRYPMLATTSLRPAFENMPWEENETFLKAWQKGKTGYPIVDAGMRQLWQTGWMHNRVRMIVASFLIKDLFIDWRVGEAWFWDTLVDADPANNAASWQWVAGCGADAAPYFRIFNPTLQSQKFDPKGDYIRTFIPELQTTPPSSIHEPWKGLAQTSFSYPKPIVNHDLCRKKALQFYSMIKEPTS